MHQSSPFNHRLLPYLLVLPQIAVTLAFFIWPALNAVWLSTRQEDAFGLSSEFVGLEHYIAIFHDGTYTRALVNTAVFSTGVTVVSLALALLLAVMADRVVRGAMVYKTLLIWPYAVAPAVAGVIWWLAFNPSIGVVAYFINILGYDWNHLIKARDAMMLVIFAAAWKQISYNFLFFLAGLQAIPRSLIEAAALDGASPFRRFWTVIFPLLSPTTFFLLVVNIIYAFFDTFALIHATTAGGPAGSTETLVLKVFMDGFVGLDLGGSSAQSVVLMVMVMALTVVQFRFVERKVQY
ncbi:sn-glycerol-3-phosphate ABC transporter permease UgpA [Novispirillum itersonii]|uniref:sn-glycerol-3-phosphate ABC transporter permease UgpA n=1 Tax=Novispirillum itersonii TaxID=189 RepID=UPI00035F7126|nr:sn-glycerol-3-phosphate ABC transporter permease UgpA [Novispirillum itersonii]